MQLADLAAREGVSLNQYIVYALSRQATMACTIEPVAERTVQEQKIAYTALLQSLGTATFAEIEQVMAERESVAPEAGLTAEMVQRLQEQIAQRKAEA